MTKNNKKIMLIEDSKLCVYAMKSIIENRKDFSAELMHCPTMTLALSALKDSSAEIDLILLDLGLPDTFDDEESFAKIKDAAPDIPIVILTGRHDRDFANHIVKDGAQDYINKDEVSANPALLVKAINFALSRHKNQKKVVTALKEKEQVISWMSGNYGNVSG